MSKKLKQCSRCKISKPLSEFTKGSRYKDGLKTWCKSCVKEYGRLRHIEKKEHNNRLSKIYYQNHIEEHRGRCKRWEAKPENRAKRKAYRDKNKERFNSYFEKYREIHREELRYNLNQYYRTHHDKMLEKGYKYRIKYPERRIAKDKLAYAIKEGIIIKPTKCSECERDFTEFKDENSINFRKPTLIHGHHEDYSEPLEVIWLCWECHARLHKNKRRVKRCTA